MIECSTDHQKQGTDHEESEEVIGLPRSPAKLKSVVFEKHVSSLTSASSSTDSILRL